MDLDEPFLLPLPAAFQAKARLARDARVVLRTMSLMVLFGCFFNALCFAIPPSESPELVPQWTCPVRRGEHGIHQHPTQPQACLLVDDDTGHVVGVQRAELRMDEDIAFLMRNGRCLVGSTGAWTCGPTGNENAWLAAASVLGTAFILLLIRS